MLEIRRSTVDDISAVQSIMRQCFGDRESTEYYDGVDTGRYLLAICDGEAVAMTGIYPDSSFPGGRPEMDWTATIPEYRGRGLMRKLLDRLLVDLNHDLYWSAWRVGDNVASNPEKLLKAFGFVKTDIVKSFRNGENCCHACTADCVYYTGDNCHCYEDVWLLRRS